MNAQCKTPLKNLSAALLMISTSFATSAFADTTKPTLEYKDVFELEYATNPQVSPDGEIAVFERKSYDIMSDGVRTSLWQVELDNGDLTPLFSDKANYRNARFSPDGKRLAYTSSKEGKTQLYVRYLDTGNTVRVTNLPTSPSNIAWSPDGKQIAFVMFTPTKSKPLFTDMPAKPKGAKWAGNATYIDSTYYRADGAGYLPSGFRQIYLVPATGGTARKITQEDNNFNSKIQWTADGQKLLINTDIHQDWENRPTESDLYFVDVKTGALENITERQGPDFSPVLSPDGKYVAYFRIEDRKLSSQNPQVYLMKLKTGETRSLTPDLDRKLGDLQWAKNGKGLYFSYDDFGSKHVGYVSTRGKFKKLPIALGGTSLGRPYTSGTFTVGKGDDIVFTQGNNQRPADLALYEGRKKVTTLTELNEDLMGHKELAKVEEITVKSSFDGRDIQAWYALPPGFDANKSYPLILEIHGGPHTTYGPHFSMEVQLMAAKGYVVVWSNPRGSTSYGEDFANLIHHNYPSEDYNDLMDVVDAMAAKSYVDNNELFITGGSGGGVLTAWSIGKTDRFKAAVVAKPVINWLSFALTADMYPYFSQYWMPGMPWDHAEHLWKRSPLSLVGNVKTPTMLLTGEVDYRTPMSETEQYYQALKLNRVDTALVKVPKASHGIAAKPSNLVQKVGYIIAWFDKYRSLK